MRARGGEWAAGAANRRIDGSRREESGVINEQDKNTMRPILVLTVVLLAVAACGGSDGDAEPENAATTTEAAAQSEDDQETPTTTEAASEPEGGEEEEAEEESTAASDVSVATVTLGDETYEFQSTGAAAENCSTTGFTRVVLYMADENGELLMVDGSTAGVVSIFPDAVELDVNAEGTKWIASSGRTGAEESSVDSFSADGNHVEGTGTFYSLGGEGPVQGSFEVTCAES